MRAIAQTISKMFVVMVLLFGSPPPVSLLQLRRRPEVMLVAASGRRYDLDPLAIGGQGAAPRAGAHLMCRPWWGQGHPSPEDAPPYPVQAA